ELGAALTPFASWNVPTRIVRANVKPDRKLAIVVSVLALGTAILTAVPSLRRPGGERASSGVTPSTSLSWGAESGKFSPEVARASLKTIEPALPRCKKPYGPTGPGRARVTFIGDGSVRNCIIDGPPYGGTAVGECVATRFRFARVP